MADKSSREIERDLEHERAELRGTIDEMLDRMTLEGAWNQAGKYLRENNGEFSQTLGRVIKEKPIAVGLVAIGMAWIMFGSSTTPSRRAGSDSFRDYDKGDDAQTRARLGGGDFGDTSARGPSGPEARPDPWSAPTRTPATPGTGSETRRPGSEASSSPAKGASTAPAVPAAGSTGSPGGTSYTPGDTTRPMPTTPATPKASPVRSPAGSGGTASAGSTPGSAGPSGADTSTTGSRPSKT